MVNARRLTLLGLLTAVALATAGGWPERLFSTEAQAGRAEALDLYDQAASLVRSRAAAPGTEEALLTASLDGMLNHLDPHSSYYTPEVYKELMEDQEGKFHGLGMLVAKPSATSPLLVVSPIPDTPASRAGLRAGDLILEIDGAPTDQMTSREAVRKLKGPAGTAVTITVGRGSAAPQKMTLKRAPIPKHTVPYSLLLEGGVGYVKVNTFGQTTVEELTDHVERLRGSGARALVLDLRDNPGGSLPAAVGVSSLFLKKGQEVLSVRGRRSEMNRRYLAEGDGPFHGMPLAVLINQGSASASEIVAGALQDHDLAELVGERSWGKGLVQTVTPLEKGAASITTARYYTPSGRSIQRDYSHSYDAYFYPDQQPAPEGPAARTDSGRTVFGGGGIAPDVAVEPYKLPDLALRLEQRRAYLDFVSREVEGGTLSDEAARADAFVQKFKASLDAAKERYTAAEWAASEAYTRRALLREYATMRKSQGEGFRAMVPLDTQLERARQLLLAPPAAKAA